MIIKRILYFICLIFILFSCNNEPKTADEFIMRGSKYLGEKKYSEAESDYFRALAREPNNIAAIYGFALTKKLQKDYRVAKDFVNVGIKVGSSSSVLGKLYNLRGEINYEIGNKDSACIDFIQAGNLGDNTSIENQNKYCK